MDIGEAIDHIWSVYVQAFQSPAWALVALVVTVGVGWVLFKATAAWFAVWVGHNAVKDDIARSRIGEIEQQLQQARIEHSRCLRQHDALSRRLDKDREECDRKLSKMYDDILAFSRSRD